MDKKYIKEHLVKLSKLIFNGEPFCYSTTKGYFVFGSKDKKGNILHKNKVEKSIALYLIVGIKVNKK
jgi:hypothetical protein